MAVSTAVVRPASTAPLAAATSLLLLSPTPVAIASLPDAVPTAVDRVQTLTPWPPTPVALTMIASPTVTLLVDSAVGAGSTAVASTSTATLLAAPTITVTRTPDAASTHVAAILPSFVVNDLSKRLTILGDGFVDPQYAVSVGERALTDVEVESTTSLTGTLPAATCPGAYAVTVTDALGRQASGGSIQVQGILSATSLPEPIVAPAITLDGRIHNVQVALPTVQIRDTTCGTGDLHLLISVGEFAHTGGRAFRLVPLSISAVQDAQSAQRSQLLTLASGQRTATLLIHRPDSSGYANVALSCVIEIPSHPAAGDYRASVSVALLEGAS